MKGINEGELKQRKAWRGDYTVAGQGGKPVAIATVLVLHQ